MSVNSTESMIKRHKEWARELGLDIASPEYIQGVMGLSRRGMGNLRERLPWKYIFRKVKK